MRIGVDASRTVVAQRTGTERYSLELLRALLAIEQPHLYLLYFNRGPAPGLIEPSPRWEARVVPLWRLWTHLRFASALAADRPDVLFVPAHVLPIRHPPRSVVTVHDLGFHRFPEAHPTLARLYLEWSTRFAARQASHLIAISACTAADLQQIYGVPAERITVVYEGVDPSFRPIADEAVRRDVARRYDLGLRPYLFGLGTLQPRKNLIALLRALRLVLDAGHDLQLVLAGRKGWAMGALETELSRLALGPHVKALGYIPDDDLPALYSGALAYVQPSLYEGFGLTVLEAMACATPVVAADTSSLPEVVGGTGLLVDPHRPASIAEAIGQLATRPALRAELGAAGRRRAATFTWERCARETLAVLESVSGD